MPTHAPTALKRMPEMEKKPAPHSEGIHPPIEEPMKRPTQMSAREFIVSVYVESALQKRTALKVGARGGESCRRVLGRV